MLKRRIILAAVIVAAGVFASFYGGAARNIFFMSLLVPPFLLLYTVYVYARFRIYQHAASKVIVKNEKTPYYFVLSNEDFISYADVRVTFYEELSSPQNMELCSSSHLLPRDKIEKRTDILCRYRGEYNIGIKNIIVTDFLGIMSIRYPAPSTISMSVLPKIPVIDRLSLVPEDNDAKLVKFSRGGCEPPDCEVRKYVPGDSIRLINWRLSAKKRELFVRQSSEVQSFGIVLIMDMRGLENDEYRRVVTEDKIIESALATSDYLVKRNVPITVAYEQGGIRREHICGYDGFKEFYGKCAGMKFIAKDSPEELFAELSLSGSGFVIFAVQSVSARLCELCENIIRMGGEAAIVLVSDEAPRFIPDRRIIFRRISLSDEVADILGGTDER